MKNLVKAVVAVTAVSVLSSFALAGPKPKTIKCPYCKMQMGQKKTKAMPVAVKLPMGTYYCCKTCHPAPKKKG